jgi:small subunit ribosomal protein S6
MTREYELVYIFDSTLEEEAINERLEQFHELLKCPESTEPITGINHWGKRTLAYEVDGKDVGYYVVVQFESRPDLLGELERALKLDEAVMRYLVVLNEGLAPLTAAAAEESEPEKAETTADVAAETPVEGEAESTTDGTAEPAANEEDKE